MNLNFPFYKKTKIPVTQMECTFTHQKTKLSQTLQEDDRYGGPNKHFPNTNGNWHQTHSRINWQNTQIALHAQKRSLPGCTTVDLLSLGCFSTLQMHVSIPPRKSVNWQPVLSRGETGSIPKTNGFSSC